ncbi:hypothetical protein SmJEL517_g05431 [Synchytrium microbalum]|uniref:AMP-binding enzyme C-terminal domain-containing protein n=1 Tax=Synchytrium microbalum TaxID=1806994 RepID=A0A507BP50_9FUNG|nr:uncharacterized protein SmJEL517_g05431 [Synchytrium microbalum]TPX31177.1 hypothetical protein SmJEL517_g05431 [Synchytrium microbalum]
MGGTSNYNDNMDTCGSIGRMGPLAKLLNGTIILRFDHEKEQPLRDPATGFCVEADYDEPGEFCVEVDPAKGRVFAGYYANDEGTNKKLIRNCFKTGDVFYRTGDLIRANRHGWCFFSDRIGDTFRWKGENVATNEVGDAVNLFEGIQETNVYGVEIPGRDGRAGMAAIVLKQGVKNLNWKKFAEHIAAQLPSYARPLFVRVLPEVPVTVTLKHSKVDLRKQGMNPSGIKEPLYFFDEAKIDYIPFTKSEYERIVSGNAKL